MEEIMKLWKPMCPALLIDRKAERKNCIVSVLLSMALMIIVYPRATKSLPVKKFDRIIGLGIADNWDIDQFVNAIYFCFMLFIVSFVFILALLEYLNRRDPQIKNRAAWKLLDTSILSAFIVITFRTVTLFWRLDSFSFGYSFILGLFILDIFYCYSGLEKKLDPEKYTIIKTSAIGISFPVAVLFTSQWAGGRKWLWFYYILLLICLAGYFLYKICPTKFKRLLPSPHSIWQLSLLFTGLPLLTSIYLELLNILNQYGIFIHSPRKLYGIILVIFGCGAFIISLLDWRRFSISGWKRTAYPLLLTGMGCLACQIPLQLQKTPNLFETANSSVLISDFLYFGKLPLVEHYGGHMLKNVVSSIIYAFINRDPQGAILSPYDGYIYVVTVLLFYLFVKELLQDEYPAFFYTLCLPFGGDIQYYIVGILICLSVGCYVKKQGYGRAFGIWISCAIAVLYRLDLGFAFGTAAVISLLIYLFWNQRKRFCQELGLTFAAVIVCGLCLWSLLCVIKNVSPVERMKEFILISMSNRNWATGSLGDKYSVFFAVSYMVIPLACALLLFYLIFFIGKDHVGSAAYYMVILLGISYFVNMPRGLVRHTLNELATKTVIFSGSLFIVSALYYVCRKQVVLLAAWILMILLLNFTVGNTTYTADPLIDMISAKMNTCIDGWSEWKNINEKKDRVQITENAAKTIDTYREALDPLLDEQETWLDFINASFLYSALERESPVYASQSPGHLSGEYTQEAFIREIEQNKERVPLALLPGASSNENLLTIDSIANVCRYYKVSEYIYQNYRPLYCFNRTAVWCRPEKYEQYSDILFPEKTPADYGYDRGDNLYQHNYPMYEIPYLWGTYDTKEGWQNPVLAQAVLTDENVYCFDPISSTDKVNGNYLLLTCDCEDEYPDQTDAPEIILGSTQPGYEDLYRFQFTLHPGRQQYLFRISADYYWYAEDINRVAVHTDAPVRDVHIQILEGD